MRATLLSILKPITYCLCFSVSLHAFANEDAGSENDRPWILSPILSSSPKLGSSVGALAAYLHAFDTDSPTSIFGVSGNYSDTDSYSAGIFTKSYFDHDQQRLQAALVKGKINNDFSDYLGTGQSASTTDELKAFALRYQHRIGGNWFLGAQAISNNYTIYADDLFTDKLLELTGLTGFTSNGIGAILSLDSRDNQNSPSQGSTFEVSNIAYRKSLGGEDSFDAYTLQYKQFIQHGSGHVLAWRVNSRVTHNAPRGAHSSVGLRGYTRGQYLAPHGLTLEVEERHVIKGRWGGRLFAGAVCLFDSASDCSESDSWYPAAGFGLSYTIKPEDKMIVRAEYAVGKNDSSGFYFNFGQAF